MHKEIAAALVAPGWSARRRRRTLAITLFLIGVVLPLLPLLYVLVTDRNSVAVSLDATFLAVVIVAGVLAISARIAALAEVWVAAGRRTSLSRVEWLTAMAATLVLVAGSVVVVEVGRARASIAPTFTPVSEGVLFDSAEPSAQAELVDLGPSGAAGENAVPPSTTVLAGKVGDGGPEVPAVSGLATTTTTLPPKPTRPDSGISAEELSDVTTVLLIGGDSGPGRSGTRTDSMMLFSMHRPSGRASLVSIPRDLERLLFPPGSAMEARYPYGYTGIANAVYPTVSSNRDLRDAYAVDGVRPGVVALAQGIGYSLDVTIHDYVFVDMQGFLDLIDALGGVTVRVTKQIPMPGNVPGARTRYPDTIGPGLITMDGSTALGYARSRKGDTDFHRARRQRDLLASLARQVSLTDVATSFGSVASAIGGTLRTSLTPDELADTMNVIGGETAIVESVGLVPPLINLRNPDFDEMATIVGLVQLAIVNGDSSGY